MAEKINKYEAIAPQILELVGGKDNIRSFAHCMTRLRFNVKDKGLVDADKIGKLPGCMGTQWAGDQLQVIIGQAVDKAYDAICAAGGLQKEAAVAEDLDSDKKKKFSLTTVCEAISGCIVPLIPLFMASGLIKVVLVMANLIGILPADSSTYTVLGYAADAALYFMPILIGYTAAKKFGADPSLAMGLCALLVYPNLMTALGGETPVTIFGLPVYNATYTNMMFPSIMVVFVMSYVERFFKKYIPDALKIMLVPTLTTAVMLPVALCVCGPIGGFLGNYICAAVIWLGNHFGFLGAAVIGALWEFLVMTGMHHVLIAQMIQLFAANGYDPVVSLGAVSASMAVTGMCLGMAFALRDKEERALSLSYTVAAIIGGVTEPGLYGIGMKYKKPFIGMAIGGAVGGLYAGLVGVKAYISVPVANFLALTAYTGGSAANIINGVISGVIAIVVAALATYLICREPKKN